jgi:AcrR family transcriptional regulator
VSSLREQQKAATRLRLLEAAETVFARRGFHGASVDKIAREAGATTGALYANFAGKEFPLFVEFWAYAVREPRVRERFAAFRLATGRIVAVGAGARGVELEPEQVERLGTFVNALANGLALEKLMNQAAVPDELFGDLLVLVFNGFRALAVRATGWSGA